MTCIHIHISIVIHILGSCIYMLFLVYFVLAIIRVGHCIYYNTNTAGDTAPCQFLYSELTYIANIIYCVMT